MVNSTELNILKLLASRNDVNWTQYNLDRALTQRKLDGGGHVAKIMDNLAKSGLVDIVPRSPEGMDYYCVSAQGVELLNNIQKSTE